MAEVAVSLAISLAVTAVTVGIQAALTDSPDDVFGPRVDPEVQSQTFGATILNSFGAPKLGGHYVWLKGNQKQIVTRSESVGGKGGLFGGGQDAHTEEAFMTALVSFGGPAAVRLRRMWFDNKPVYDVDGEKPLKLGVNFLFHRGDPDQRPCPHYEADVGVGRAPAFRGEATVTLINIPLKDYGNRLPKIDAEIEFEPGGETVFTTTSVGIGPIGADVHSGMAMIDFDLRRAYIGDANIFNSSDAYGVVDLETMTLAGVFQNNFDLAGIDHEGNLFGSRGDEATNKLIEPYSGTLAKEFTVVGNRDDQSLGRGVQISLVSPLLAEKIYVCLNRDGFFSIDDHTFINIIYSEGLDFGKHYASHKPYPLSGPRSYFSNIVEAGRGSGVAWVVAHAAQAGTIDIWQVRINGPIESPLNPIRTMVQFAKVVSYAPADFDGQGGGVSQSRNDAAYDPSDRTLVSFARLHTPTRTVAFKWSPTIGLVWKTTVPPPEVGGGGTQQRLAGQTYAYLRPEASNVRITMLDLTDGAILINDQIAPGIINNPGHGMWDDERRTLYSVKPVSSSFQATRIGATARQPVARSKIIAETCLASGMPAARFDVTGVSGTEDAWVRGNEDGQTFLQPLLEANFIDPINEGFKLVFKDRQSATVGTIREQDLIVDQDGRALRPRRTQEHEIPEMVTVNYRDFDNGHAEGSQSYKRNRLPTAARTLDTRRKVTLNLRQASMTAVAARAMAVAQQTAAENRRAVFDCRGPIALTQYNPGDPLLLERDDGSIQRVLMTANPIGADSSTETALVVEDFAQYSQPQVTADTGRINAQQVPNLGPSKAFLLNSTILRDVDATDRTFGRLLWGAAPLSGAGDWPGALLYRLFGDTDFEPIGRQSNPAAWGVVTLAPPASDRPHVTEAGSSFEVAMVEGFETLATTTPLNMLNGANTAMLVKPDGTGEVVSFQNVTDLGDNKVRLSVLLRGRRGTDAIMGATAVGDIFLLLARGDLSAVAMAPSRINGTELYKIPTNGMPLELAPARSFTYLAYDQKPWAPAHVTATLNGSNDLVFTWVRRTRHGGGWLDGSGTVPLNEDSEVYELEILDGPGGAVLRTVTGLTGPTHTYLNADILADFVSIPATIDVRVYQISAQAGRGFTIEVQLETGA